jgi:uncharacterized protein involved in exopolysaccharide biosynthesis
LANRLTAAPRPQVGPAEDPSIVGEAQRIAALYVGFVRHHRLLLVGLPLLVAALAAGITLARPRSYQGQLTVAVSRASEDSALVVANFRPFLENNGVLDETIKEFKLDQPPFNLTRTVLLRDHYSVEPIRNTNLVTVRLRLTDPQLVARVLNQIGDRAAKLVAKTTVDLGAKAQAALKAQLDEAALNAQKADLMVQHFKHENQIELLRRDIDAMLGQRGALLDLSVKIGAERSRLAQLEADLKTHQRVDDLSRTIDDDPLLTEAARQQRPSGSSLVGLSVKSQFANPVFAEIDTDAAKSRANLAALLEQRRQLVDAQHLSASQFPLLSKLYAAENQLSDLEREAAIAHDTYKAIAAEYQLASLHVVDRNAQLAIIDPALPPDVPEARGLVVNTALGAAAGLGLAIVAIILRRPPAVLIERTEVR